jgi:hypothetical protein
MIFLYLLILILKFYGTKKLHDKEIQVVNLIMKKL